MFGLAWLPSPVDCGETFFVSLLCPAQFIPISAYLDALGSCLVECDSLEHATASVILENADVESTC